jgi:hypothetical protein
MTGKVMVGISGSVGLTLLFDVSRLLS